jgi:aminopeptidase N
MLDDSPRTIFRKEYCVPDFLFDAVNLEFELGEEHTEVRSRIDVQRNPTSTHTNAPLVLDGEELALVSVHVDGQQLPEAAYEATDETLTLHDLPGSFTLEIVTRIEPQNNTSFMGLFESNGMFCTQCEADGFRRITYYLDRPDVMSSFTTTIIADQGRYPILLSNGNRVETGQLEGGRHWARWEDPFKKPSYLFALVAGDLDMLKDQHTTCTGRTVELEIYVDKGQLDKCHHAMKSLQKAMKWDEDVFGLEYDLDIYMIVAVSHFNMGAMENKGLNVFNTKYVLAREETATDSDFEGVEAVIGHEYFHNWTGNRVTCQDWFQLTLKEGLTVFRDEEFTSDMNSRPVKRIQDVRALRGAQFSEDAGPMAHPIRPDSYVEVNNFYTMTVYRKGAAVIRMIHTLLGQQGFRKGMDLYFERHDGQAVTCDDFVAAMADANGADLEQFKNWYSQAGTPSVQALTQYNDVRKEFSITLRQSCAPTPGQDQKHPFHIPVLTALLDREGAEIPLRLQGTREDEATSEVVLNLKSAEQTFVFEGVSRKPIPSMLRNFSAPVKLKYEQSPSDLIFLMSHDTDPFNRWEAGQTLATQVILSLVNDRRNGDQLHVAPSFIDAFRAVLEDKELDRALAAQAIGLPSEQFIGEQMETIDVDGIYEVREFLRLRLAQDLEPLLEEVVKANTRDVPYSFNPSDAGRRSLRNACLSYLSLLGHPTTHQKLLSQVMEANNMTESLAALACLSHLDVVECSAALDRFYDRWRDDALVLDKWFSIQAMSKRSSATGDVKRLLNHPDFDIKNPNRLRSLVGAFSMGNPHHFHAKSGAGYALLEQKVLDLDSINPQLAARLVQAFTRWKKYDTDRQALMEQSLRRIMETEKLSKDVYEIVSKSLA